MTGEERNGRLHRWLAREQGLPGARGRAPGGRAVDPVQLLDAFELRQRVGRMGDEQQPGVSSGGLPTAGPKTVPLSGSHEYFMTVTALRHAVIKSA